MRLHGEAVEILWRMVAMVLMCISIVRSLTWYLRWLVGQVTIGSAE